MNVNSLSLTYNNSDNFIAPNDALQVIDAINSGAAGEGESAAPVTTANSPIGPSMLSPTLVDAIFAEQTLTALYGDEVADPEPVGTLPHHVSSWAEPKERMLRRRFDFETETGPQRDGTAVAPVVDVARSLDAVEARDVDVDRMVFTLRGSLRE